MICIFHQYLIECKRNTYFNDRGNKHGRKKYGSKQKIRICLG